MPIDKYKTPNSSINFHGKHPRLPPKGNNLSTGRLLHRPHQHIADAPVACFVTAVHSYIECLSGLDNGTATLLARLQELGEVARVMGPGVNWGLIAKLAARIRARHRPVRDKTNLKLGNELVDLGFALMGSATRQTRLAAAIAYRDGLIIALLAHVPLRRRNLADLRLGQTIIRQESGFLIAFNEDETKTHAAFEMKLPEVLIEPLADYLTVWRPILARRTGRWSRDVDDALWVSKDGSPLTQIAIYDRVTVRTKAAFGRSINPHLFRDSAATTMAIADPAHVRIAAPLLGHRTLSTTERHYQQAKGYEAQRSFLEVITEHKEAAPHGRRNR